MSLQIIFSTLLFSTTDWISAITASAALVTAIITLITVIELRKQRQHSYQPDLDISNFEFYVYKYDKDEEEFEQDLIFLFYTKDKLDENAKVIGYNELLLDISNTGFGAAKAVKWEWSFDFISAQNAIKLSKKEFKFHETDNKYYVKVSELKVDWIIMVDEDNETDYINFVLPYSIENRKNTIRIPSYFIELFWLYKTKDMMIERLGEDQDFPPLKLYVSYTNLDGKKFNRCFQINLGYSYICNPFNPTNDLGKFRFEILKIK
jgi:hypothetical protein